MSVERLWGSYQDHLRTPTLVIKTLRIRDGESTSYQRHEHRSEIWEVMEGAVEVYLCGVRSVRFPGDRVFVARGAWHSARAVGGEAVILEHQVGAECREDDIERREQ